MMSTPRHQALLKPTLMALGLATILPGMCRSVLKTVKRLRSLIMARLQSVPHSISPTTLDPGDWDELRRNAHALLDASINKMAAASQGRVWTPLPSVLKATLQNTPLPTKGMAHDELCVRLLDLLPYGVGNTHPRFFGWVHGSGNPGGVLPELVAAAMNANCGGRDHAAIYVERQVLAWCRSIMGFPGDCGALLVSGTSMATVVALKAARDATLGFVPSRQKGMLHAQKQAGELVGYAAEGTHSCIKRAFDILGLGSEQLRLVPCDADFTMRLDALGAMAEADRAAGLRPFLVVGTAGSVNVGAIDDLSGIADWAERQGIWFHVDGAFGAAAVLSPEARPRLVGLERASSLAFDFHKWLHVNYDAGCVLVRDHQAHLRAFSERPDYLVANTRGIAANNPWPTDFGPELSRGFRALKVWAHLLEHGTERLGAAITANLAHARHLAGRIDQAPGLRRLAPATLNIVVFRYEPPAALAASEAALTDVQLDQFNDEIVIELQERGIAAPSTTRVHGRLAIRVNITNHRTRMEDLDLLVEHVLSIASELSARAPTRGP